MIVFFVLLLLVVQVGFLVGSRMLVVSAVEASARRLATSGDAGAERARLVAEIGASVPGALVVDADVATSADRAHVEVVVDWSPPGPDLVPMRFDIGATRFRVVPP